MDGRNFLQLTALDANVMYGYSPDVGAATSRMGGERNEMDISVAGGRPEFDYYTLDGVSNTDVNFNTYTFLPSIDAIQEFKIQTGVFPAEFGRGTAQINANSIASCRHRFRFRIARVATSTPSTKARTNSLPDVGRCPSNANCAAAMGPVG